MTKAFSQYLHHIKKPQGVTYKYDLSGSTPPFPNFPIADGLVTDLSESVRPKLIEAFSHGLQEKAGSKNFAVTPILGGCSNAFFLCIAALTDKHVVTELPGYEPFWGTLDLLNRKTSFFKRQGDFEKQFKAIKKLCSKKSSLVITNPHLPSGTLYTAAQIAKLSKLVQTLIVDESYYPHFSGGKITMASEMPGVKNSLANKSNIAFISGLSKTCGLSSPRVGWCFSSNANQQRLIRAIHLTYTDMSNFQLTIGLAALKAWDKIVANIETSCQQNRQLVRTFASEYAVEMSHAFQTGNFGCIRVPKKFKSADAFAAALAKKDVSVRSCDFFGLPNFVRLNLMVAHGDFAKALAVVQSMYPPGSV